MSLYDLYQEMILDHGRHPRHFGNLPNATHTHLGYNPLCGDKCMVYIIARGDHLEDIRFEGQGCAISMASASLMSETIKGKSLTEFNQLFDAFCHLVMTGKEEEVDRLGKLSVLVGVHAFPTRVKCATLVWHTVKAALTQSRNVISTE